MNILPGCPPGWKLYNDFIHSTSLIKMISRLFSATVFETFSPKHLMLGTSYLKCRWTLCTATLPSLNAISVLIWKHGYVKQVGKCTTVFRMDALLKFSSLHFVYRVKLIALTLSPSHISRQLVPRIPIILGHCQKFEHLFFEAKIGMEGRIFLQNNFIVV